MDTNYKRDELFAYWLKKANAPYYFETKFDDWEKAMFHDTDENGYKLFKELHTYVEYNEQQIVGFVQFGITNIGFDEDGELTRRVNYPVIRFLVFDNIETGKKLLDKALELLPDDDDIYAYFHYFGMTCYAGHGKLFENDKDTEMLLKETGFVTEHKNAYYTRALTESDKFEDSEIELSFGELSKGQHQYIDFSINSNKIGDCEIHYLPQGDICYLRWIYIDNELLHKGYGTRCMKILFSKLFDKGIRKFDTDTANKNITAQGFYEKLGFEKKGITRSFILRN